MNLERFSEMVVEELRNELEQSVTITVNPVIKNNNNILLGLHIRSEDNMLAPVIYLDEFYERFVSGDLTMKEVIKKVLELNNTRPDIQKYFQLEEFLSWDKAKNNIDMRIISQNMNEELLKDVPWIPQNDLAVIFCYQKYEEDDSVAYSILLHNHHVAQWQVTTKELLEVALQNFPVDDVVITSMTELLDGFVEEFGVEISDAKKAEINMYVLTNRRKQYGAVGIVHMEVLKEFSAKHGNRDVLIIPSSVHECILIPLNGDEDMSLFNEMIQEVNATQLSSEDILSDHAYIYRWEDNEIQSVIQLK